MNGESSLLEVKVVKDVPWCRSCRLVALLFAVKAYPGLLLFLSTVSTKILSLSLAGLLTECTGINTS